MLIGQRLREIRDAKNLSQDDIEKATGLVRPYISRVENSHTIPSIETLQKWASALGMQLYQVLYDGEEPPKPPKAQSKIEEWCIWLNLPELPVGVAPLGGRIAKKQLTTGVTTADYHKFAA